MIALAYKRLLQLGKVAGALTFLFGIPYGTFQYVQAKHVQRVAQSLQLFKDFNSSPFTKYRENINSAVALNKSQLAAAATDEKELQKTVLSMIEKQKIEIDLLMMMDFFDGVTVCVIDNLCDADTTERLFGQRARELYINFYQYIDLQRKTIATAEFGLGLETIALTTRAKPKNSVNFWSRWL